LYNQSHSLLPGSNRGLDHRAALDRVLCANFPVDPPCLSTGLVLQYFQIPFWRICLFDRARRRSRRDLFRYTRIAMKKISFLVLGLASLSVTAFPADRHIAFERNQAVWSANFGGT